MAILIFRQVPVIMMPTSNGLTYKYDSTDGVWNLEERKQLIWRQTSGLSTTTSVGINTDDVDRKTLVSLGNSFNGLYENDGVFLTDKVMTGNHYISTQFNGCCRSDYQWCNDR